MSDDMPEEEVDDEIEDEYKYYSFTINVETETQ